MKQPLFAGVARYDVTPPLGYLLQGHTARNKPSERVHDPLYLKVLTLRKGKRRIALVTSDLIDFSPEFVEEVRGEVRARTRLKPADVLLTASHTHTGPVMAQGPFSDRAPLPDYMSVLKRTIAGGIGEAIRREQPVTVRHGTGRTNIGIVNRRKKTRSGVQMMPNPEGPIDEELAVVSFVDSAQKPLAVLLNYTCHPTTLASTLYQVSADYPGVAQRELEKFYPGATALFINGCCGDVRPAIVDGDRFKGGGFDDIERMGKLLAAAAVQCVETAHSVDVNSVGGRLQRFAFPLDRTLSATNKANIAKITRRYARGSELGAKWAAFWEQARDEGRQIPTSVTGDLHGLKIGPLAVLGLPGEVMVEIGLKIKKRTEKVIVAGYSNGCIGYIPTRQGLVEGGYEASSFLYQAWPAPYAPAMERKLVEAAVKLVG
ncbi:MAG: neutral/alkaline non-lysosomal ceramidase N-terminal domain-containing protein [Kiritimatiellae bacterium]|nr:neutral/alkaline non-lysosomal ceramidase N-terminal domain-containing protein [Kiritimatiellia bacterium]